MKTLLTASLCLIAAAALAQTVVTPVNVGTTANDGTGDPLRTAIQKLNGNDANLNSGKLEKTNPVVSGILTGDQFGVLPIGDTLKIGSAGTIQGFGNVITGPTHTWFTLELTPGAAGGAPGTPSSVIVHSPLSAQQMNATTFGDWNGFTGYEWMHGDGSFSLDKTGNTNVFSGRRFDLYGSFTDSSNYKRGSLYFSSGDFYIDDNGAGTGGGGSLGNFVLNAGISHSLQIHFGGTSFLNAFYNFDTNRFATLTTYDNLLDLGGSDRRWKNLYVGTDANIGGDVSAGGTVSAGNSVSVAGGSSSLGPLALTLAGATISQTTASATSPTRGWRQVNFGFFVSPTGPTNNFFQFDAETLFKGAGDYAGYEWLHQDGSVSFDKAGTTNKFTGVFTGALKTPRFAVAIANGANSDIAIGTNNFVELTGASAAFTTHGFANGIDGMRVAILNQLSQTWTIANESTTDTTAANRIRTLTGGDIILYGNCTATFIYSANDSRWIFAGSTLTPHAANRKTIAATTQITQVAQTFANNTPVPLEARLYIRSESGAVQVNYNGQNVSGGSSITTLNYPTYFLLQPADSIQVLGASSFTADVYTNSF